MTLTTAVVVGLSSSLLSTPVFAQTNDELENIKGERTEVQEDLSAAEAQVADVLKELDQLNKDIEKTDKALKENQKVMNKTEKKIETTEDEIDTLEKEIKKLEDKIEERFEILKERAVSYQKNGGDINYMEVIFGSQSFSDFISRVSAVNKITESDAKLIEEQENDKASVEEKQGEKEEKLEELKAEKTELEGMLEVIEDQQKQNKEAKSSLKSKEQELTALVSELKIEDSRLSDLEDEAQQQLLAEAEAEAQAQQEAAAEAEVEPAPDTQVANSTADTNEDDNSNSTNSNSGSSDTKSGNSNSKKESSDSTASPAPKANGNIDVAINAGFNHLGTPYVWGGKNPSGFDCSGFVSWAFSQAGISVPSYTGGLAGTGTKVSSSNMQPGDIVFFDTYKKNGHVGIYLGGGQFIGAQSSTGLAVANMSSGYWADKFNGHVRRVN